MRRARRSVVVFLAAVISGTLGTATATVAVRRSAPPPPVADGAHLRRGMAALAALPVAATDRLLAVATFRPGGAGRAAARQGALARLGLGVEPLRRLPLALVSGTRAQLEAAVRQGVATDVYPDERLRYFSAESTAAIRADGLRASGVTGKGVGVAVVDTGVDATHPDLADHVPHNLKVIGAEHLDLLGDKHDPADPPGTLAVEMHALPYANSDTSSGHGTHVAGIVAADAHTSPDQVGVAPDATIVAYGAGDALQIFTVLAAFDHILEHHDEWGIRVVNNSWGQSGRLFDPAHPINVATKALHDAGLVVVFAAGNDGEEGTINPYSVAPWVISVASATNARARSGFSSGGYEHDNSVPADVPDDRHVRFEGDRIGIYHPDVSAPGTDITSSGTITGVGVLSPALPGGTATLSGTSMAAPHVAGLAALLLQARPSLGPDDVRRVLQVTAAPMGGEAPFWRSGYGFTDAQAAVDLVRRPDFGPALLDRLQAEADERVLGARTFAVRASDLWTYEPLLASVAGSDTRTFETVVSPGTAALKAVVSYPTLGLVGVNPFDWRVTVRDADGKAVATSTPSTSAGVSSLFVELDPAARFGTWSVEVAGVFGAADTDALLGKAVTLAVAQVEHRAPEAVATARFVAEGTQALYFQRHTAAPLLPVPLPSPEGCELVPGAPVGTMGSAAGAGCTSALVGYAVTHAADQPATFTSSAALAAPLVVGGPSRLTLWLADAAAPVWTQAAASRIAYELEAVDGAGKAVALAAGDLDRVIDGPDEVGIEPTRAEYEFAVVPATVPAGSTLRLQLRFSGAYASTMRMFFGGPYADAGLTLGTGRMNG